MGMCKLRCACSVESDLLDGQRREFGDESVAAIQAVGSHAEHVGGSVGLAGRRLKFLSEPTRPSATVPENVVCEWSWCVGSDRPG